MIVSNEAVSPPAIGAALAERATDAASGRVLLTSPQYGHGAGPGGTWTSAAVRGIIITESDSVTCPSE